jgi:hypothetical protein
MFETGCTWARLIHMHVVVMVVKMKMEDCNKAGSLSVISQVKGMCFMVISD